MKKVTLSAGIALSLLLAACTRNDDRNAVGQSAQATGAAQTNLAVNGTAPATPFTTAYVEVNSNSFHNPGCYIYGSPAKQVFSFAMIFAANINANANGKPVLYFNPQVQSALSSGNVAYLKSLGIKVMLTVLGNHENAGWGCFTSYSVADSFPIQCANAVSQYGLDGIDIDDEYSTCTTNASSLVLAVTALRARLGTSKYIPRPLFNEAQF